MVPSGAEHILHSKAKDDAGDCPRRAGSTIAVPGFSHFGRRNPGYRSLLVGSLLLPPLCGPFSLKLPTSIWYKISPEMLTWHPRPASERRAEGIQEAGACATICTAGLSVVDASTVHC